MNLFWYDSDTEFVNYVFSAPFSSTLQLRKEFTKLLIMRTVFICPLIALFTLLFYSCENSYRNRGQPSTSQPSTSSLKKSASPEAQKAGLAKGAYQVTSAEFDEFFIYRYGLLYQKFSDNPFSGRIVTIDQGDKGDFVSQDEAWVNGRKDGVSTRWFSNGIKMYERNYNEGKWHGTVTRWWPNGQKMYVRAYTQGKRSGKEATWRSDGTPIDQTGQSASASPSSSSGGGDSLNSSDTELPSVFVPSSSESTESEPAPLTPLDDPELSLDPIALPSEPVLDAPSADLGIPEAPPAFEPLAEPSVSAPEMPAFEPLGEPGLPPLSEPGLPPLQAEGNSLPPGLPPLEPDSPATEEGFPAMPLDPAPSDGGLPPLPGEDIGGLPPMPEADSGGLPPLPDDGGLPPLPDSGGLPPLPDDGGLPPLPDF